MAYLNLATAVTASTENDRARAVDPLSLQYRAHRGFVLMFARQFDAAIEQLQTVLQAYPNASMAHEYLALSLGGKQRHADAIAEYRKFIAIDRPYPFIKALLAHAYAARGRPTEALAILHELSETKPAVSPTALSVVYIGLGDHARALDTLDRAWAEHDNLLQYVKTIWLVDPLRADTRFQRLLERMGFPYTPH